MLDCAGMVIVLDCNLDCKGYKVVVHSPWDNLVVVDNSTEDALVEVVVH